MLGRAFIAVGTALFLGVNHMLEAAALRILPAWFVVLSVNI